ncbi:DUF1127 domain-containing protein [Shimia sp.]|uniref:DUF1127 domain-containing protein n=1 Tax=Shimia sp. TaxID=1954381 RepID=UPI003299E5EF
MAHANTVVHFEFPFSGRAVRAWEEITKARELRQKFNRTYAELNGLTDNELSDIGIARYDIKGIAREQVYGL